ncbi:MAG: hypothetical protein DSZ28_01395 [Thiothrix sp.]|nr:MAG: hypothetical protein DSZ28_01395 [Thiothrix sp.]
MTSSTSHNTLPRGYQLLWYQIDRVLGRGTFGVTYLATDTNLDRQVAVKEYFPLEFSVRKQDFSVQALNTESEETHLACLQRFLTEARTLAKLNHPNIVRVYNVFESNDTAYMAMEYEQGESLNTLIRGRKLQEETRILKILHPMLDAVEYIHERGFIHRDIKPSNIYIHQNDSPVLLDFGSTRVTPKQDSDTLTQLVSQGYAPHEQYGGGAGRQGQWTDIYALGATFYALVCNRSPVNALERVSAHSSKNKDPLTPASILCAKKYSPKLLNAIDTAMQVIPSDRPESINALRKLFPTLNPTFTDDSSFRQPTSKTSTQSNRPAPIERETFITLRSEIRDYSNTGNSKQRIKNKSSLLNKGTWSFLSVMIASTLAWLWIETPTAIPDETEKEKQTQSILEEPKTNTIKPTTSEAEFAKKPQPNINTNFNDTLTSGEKGPELVLISAQLLRKNASIKNGNSPPTPLPPNVFFLGRYEVSFAEYEQFVNATNRQLPSDSGWGRDRRPVMNVSWHDASAYTQWLSDQTGQHYRLPSEEEWSFAASSGTQTAYWWGDNIGKGKANCSDCGSEWDGNMTAPVGSFKPNFFGLYDTAGNVWEWVQDCSDKTKTYTDDTIAQTEQCNERVFLGGAWNSKASALTSSKRNGDGPELLYRYVGFRVARDI